MKKPIYILLAAIALCCIFMCAFTLDMNSSVKSLTKPYINTYECTSATLGEENVLNTYEYIKVTFLDGKQLEVSYKQKGGKRKAHVCDYTFDEDKKILDADLGVFGFRYRQQAKIENGGFTVSMPIMFRQLIMRFKVI